MAPLTGPGIRERWSSANCGQLVRAPVVELWQIDLVMYGFPGLPLPTQIALFAIEILVFGGWIAAWFSVIFTPTEVWSASGQRKWVIVVALILLGPILASLAYWFGFRRALKRRTFVRGSLR